MLERTDIYEAIAKTMVAVKDPAMGRDDFVALALAEFKYFDEVDLGKLEYWLYEYFDN